MKETLLQYLAKRVRTWNTLEEPEE